VMTWWPSARSSVGTPVSCDRRRASVAGQRTGTDPRGSR
jgi:hypothetical protein